MIKLKSFLHDKGFVRIFLAASLLTVGLFYEFLSCAASALMCVYLIYTIKKNGCFVFRTSLGGITVIFISLMYGVSAFWAVDPGMAFIGFLKFIPITLLTLIIMQFKNDGMDYLDILPSTAAIMTVVSEVLSLIPPISEIFAPAGRLSGFLQYSNTFALILLVSIIITAEKDKLNILDYIYLVIFSLGILLSGSRTVFALTLLTVVLIIVFNKGKKLKLTLLIIITASTAASVLYALLSGNFDTIGRFLTTSLGESTFVGRLLYFYDALPIILKKPFGTGYLGFYYLQQSVQTGLYSVRYVHNDFLQLMLDIGWIPAIMLIVTVARSLFKKDAPFQKRLILLVMTAHCMFDFDLQFIAVFFIYILLFDSEKGKEYKLKGFLATLHIPLLVIGCGSIYMMTALTAAWTNSYAFSNALYPYNTDVNIGLLTEETDPVQMDRYADKIISQNKYVTVAYSAKAAFAFSKGDFTNFIKFKDLAIQNAPLVYEEYEDYVIILLTGYELYIQASDIQSAEFCLTKVNELISDINSLNDRLSALGKKIDDQPQTQLPQEILQYKNALY